MPDITFSGSYIDRQGSLRSDPAALDAARTERSTRFIVIWRGQCLIHEAGIALLTGVDISALTQHPEHSTFLGTRNHSHIFALDIDMQEAPDCGTDMQFVGLRSISMQLNAADAALAAYARAILGWQNNHQHCGLCGAQTATAEGGFVMVCTNDDCGHRSFPRLDPAVIVLVHHNERALLGRQPQWPKHRFSTIAGFVEPGESLEDAVRREVIEETNIRVGKATYRASQPWPFPAALMVGFHAHGLSADIKLNDGELEEARWVTRQDISSGDIVLPPEVSVAYHLIETWFDQYSGPTLAELDLPVRPFHQPRPVDKNN